MGSDESHFNVSVGSEGQGHKTVSTNHNLFGDKGQLKRYRTEVLPLTAERLIARPNRLTGERGEEREGKRKRGEEREKGKSGRRRGWRREGEKES